MKLKPVRNDRELNRALKRIDELWGGAQNPISHKGNRKDMSSCKWVFPARFKAGAYGWKASSLACQRLREAVSEIKEVAKKDLNAGAEGAVRFLEKLWPAVVNCSSRSIYYTIT